MKGLHRTPPGLPPSFPGKLPSILSETIKSLCTECNSASKFITMVACLTTAGLPERTALLQELTEAQVEWEIGVASEGVHKKDSDDACID